MTYFKRYRMEIDLRTRRYSPRELPSGYRLLPWDNSLLAAHAEAKYNSFRHEVDANVFPCLGDAEGCLRLMREIVEKEGFLPAATWLLAWEGPRPAFHATHQRTLVGQLEYCGTVQGIRDRSGMGSVQNLGITPEHRDRSLGTVLMQQALEGFRRAGLRHAFLEVTAQNEGAIRLYRRLGFCKARTVYKAVEVACA